MSKPVATGGNEPKQSTVREVYDKYHDAIKSRPRPTRPAWRYEMAPDGTVKMSLKDLAYVASGSAERDKDYYEKDLQMWYEQQGVCQEPYLPGETLEQYQARNGKL